MGEENIIENETDLHCPKCGSQLYLWVSKYEGEKVDGLICKNCDSQFAEWDVEDQFDPDIPDDGMYNHIIPDDYPPRLYRDYDDYH